MSAETDFSVSRLRQVLRDELNVEPNSALYVAFSGGLDSHVLLHALATLAAHYPFSLNAIHIDHALQTSSADWANHCQQVCDELSVPVSIRMLQIDRKTGESLEAIARDARYAELAECLPPGALCMTAQHRNDQSETLLLQLLRGAGVHGLSAMPASKAFSGGRLLRPLLGFSRQQLLDYAGRHQLVWVEDPSNRDNRFDRNFLRNEVVPLLRQRWPGMDKSLSRSARHAASASSMLDELAKQDLRHCKAAGNHFFPPCIASLDARLLADLAPLHAANALRYWVRVNGLPVPGDLRIQSLLLLLDKSSSGTGCVDWSGGRLRLENNILWLCDDSDDVSITDKSVDWVLPAPMKFQNLELKVKEVSGEGLSKSLLSGSAIQVRFRKGGEQCRMPGNHGKKSLKILFQDLSIPSWMRNRIPLVFFKNELVAVSSFWSDPHYLPRPDEEGYVFSVTCSNSLSGHHRW